MSTWKEIGMPLLASALFIVILLRVTGELHLSSKALEFFALYWVAQATMTIGSAWRKRRNARSIGTAPPSDSPALL
jgi:hypothetical protein